jgi:nitrogen fixation protein FixH
VAQSAGRLVAVSLPIDHARNARGTVTLYRPSDSTADRLFQLAVDSNGRQYLSLDGLAAGRWIVQVRWSDGDRDYYVEQPVFAK